MFRSKRVLFVHPRLASLRGARVGGAGALLSLLGIRLALAGDEGDEGLLEHFAERLSLAAPEEVDQSWPRVRAWLDRHPTDAVFAQTEAGLLLGALAARHAGVRGPSVDAAHASTNKLLTRTLLRAAGVPQPEFALVSSAQEARRFTAAHGFPVVLKAVASARQRLVTLVRTPEALDGAVAHVSANLAHSSDVRRLASFCQVAGLDPGCDPTEQFLVESFAAGDPIESDGLLFGAERLPFGVVEQVHCESPPFFIEGYLFPADRPAPELEAIEAVTAAALRALDLKDTGYSVELRARGGTAHVIEVNGRLGIDEGLGDLFEVVLGKQPVRMALELALGKRPRCRPNGTRAALAYRTCTAEVEVRSLPSRDAVRELERLDLPVGIHAALGERLAAPGTAADVRPHLAHCLARDTSSSWSAYERARAGVERLNFELVATNGRAV